MHVPSTIFQRKLHLVYHTKFKFPFYSLDTFRIFASYKLSHFEKLISRIFKHWGEIQTLLPGLHLFVWWEWLCIKVEEAPRMSLGINLVFSFANCLKKISETAIVNYFLWLSNKGMQHASSLLCWMPIHIWDLLQFTMGGQSPGGLDWYESCAEEEHSSYLLLLLWIIMFWFIRKIPSWDSQYFFVDPCWSVQLIFSKSK